jgi:hypothetical protein
MHNAVGLRALDPSGSGAPSPRVASGLPTPLSVPMKKVRRDQRPSVGRFNVTLAELGREPFQQPGPLLAELNLELGPRRGHARNLMSLSGGQYPSR